MAYYIAPLVFFYLMFGLGRVSHRPALTLFLGALPAILIAVLRGNIGLDTPNYVNAIEILREAGEAQDLFEPLFEQILLWLGRLPIAPMGVLAIVSLATTSLLLVGWLKLEPALVIFSGIFTQFFFDMTMNGLRYGLAFSLIVVSANMLLSRRPLAFWGLVLAASMIQLSSGLFGVLLYMIHEGRIRALVYSSLFGVGILLSFNEYLLFKLVANEVLQSPSAFSGLAPLGAIGAMLAVWVFDPGARRHSATKVIMLAVLAFATYGITQITYAGLRLQTLIVFLTSLALACHLRRHEIRLARASVIAIVVLGIVFGGLRLRNFQQTDETTEAPFIPYKFFWEPQ